jgi:hypothetical protein
MTETSSDPLFSRIHALAVGVLEGTLSSAERQELESLLLENPDARRNYLEHVQESACLRWLCVEEFGDVIERCESAQPARSWGGSGRRITTIVSGGILATALIAVAAMQFVGSDGAQTASDTTPSDIAVAPMPDSDQVAARTSPSTVPQGDTDRNVVATITAINSVKWEFPTAGAHLLSRCEVGDRLRLLDGSAELTFDAGVQVKVFGPADFEITSATSIRCLKGRVTTLVDKRGRGFTIETPWAKVVDLGTQFGLSISDSGETEVVVFQGMVDLSYSPSAAGDPASRRMRQGEALLVKNSGEFERVMAVQRNSFMDATERSGQRVAQPVIADVRDNIRGAESAKSYQIVHGGLEDDALAFVDRGHEWNGLEGTGLPEFLAGADYIMPFNGDKFVSDLELTVDVSRPATLYVFLDNNMAVPDWLLDGFTDTGIDIGLDCSVTKWHKDHSLGVGPGRSVDFPFSVWKRDVPQAGTITLGGIEPPQDRTQGFNMYGIAVVAKD